ncbi:helix-turn-helix domain-containing protein [Ekhidna sp.]
MSFQSYNKSKAAAAVTLYSSKELPISEITSTLGISRSTLYEYLRREVVM